MRKQNNYELQGRRSEIEQSQRWQDEVARLPWIQFPSDWKVKMIPPYGDAVVRFLVTLPDGKEKSVYHDSRASLGLYFGDGEELIPYWEVYPVNGDVGRCGTDEVELLLEMIAEGSEEKEEADVDGWVTDREPTQGDAMDDKVWFWSDADNKAVMMCSWLVGKGEPWMPIAPPEPYVKPKRWSVAESKKIGFIVYDSTKVTKVVADSIPTREAAERIAAIYEEEMP